MALFGSRRSGKSTATELMQMRIEAALALQQGQIRQQILMGVPGSGLRPAPLDWNDPDGPHKDPHYASSKKAALSDAFDPDFLPGRGATFAYRTGWRSWPVSIEGGIPRLIGAVASYTWPPNKPAVALPEELDGEAQGINAYTEDWMAEQRSAPHEGTATGVIGAWGRVIVHEHGFRAQYAYPLAIEVTGRPRLQRALEKTYGLRMSVEQFEVD